MLDVLILTHNEELNLPSSMASVAGLARRVFVLDSGSTDQTIPIARAAGAEVIHHDWEGYAQQRNWALDNVKFESPWILILDADESLSPNLAEEIRQIVTKPPETIGETAFSLNRVLIFMGRPIRHCGYFPSWNIRLFKRGMARYEQRQVHEHMIVNGPIGNLRALMRHEDRRGLEHYIAKHNRYSTLEARELYSKVEPWPGFGRFFNDRTARRRFIKYRLATKIGVPWVWRFFYMYFFRGGFLDAKAGLCFCLFISTYEMFIRMKYQDLVWAKGAQRTGIDGLAIPEGGMHPLRHGASIASREGPPMTINKPANGSSLDVHFGAIRRPIISPSSQWSLGRKAVRLVGSMVGGSMTPADEPKKPVEQQNLSQ